MRWKLINLLFGLIFGSWAIWAIFTIQIPSSHKNMYKRDTRAIDVSATDLFSQAFPGFDGRLFLGDFESIDRLNHQYAQWPAMHSLGDLSQVGDRKIAIQDHLLVLGSGEMMSFTPTTGEKQVIGRAMKYVGADWDKVIIPPGSSLVMVQIQVQPEAPPDCSDFLLYRFVLEVPTYPAVQAWNFPRNDRLGNYSTADTGCLTSGWLYFYVPALQIDMDQAWIAVTGLFETGPSASIWRLSP
ncbi:MAG: hypothetical protein JXN59_14075 [Anaerolineae bacterium]|nr:hypothetical protein [Anaerolineae bacterium]